MYTRTDKEASRGRERERERERNRGSKGEKQGRGKGEEEEEEVSEKETHRQQEKRKGEGEGRGGERVLVIAPFLVPFPVPPRSFLFAVTVYGFPFTRFHSLSFPSPPHTFLCALSPPSDLLLVFFFFLLFFIFFFSCKCFLPWLPIGFGPFFFHSPYPSLPLSLHSTPQRTLFSRVPPSLPSLSLSLSLSLGVSRLILLAPPAPPPHAGLSSLVPRSLPRDGGVRGGCITKG